MSEVAVEAKDKYGYTVYGTHEKCFFCGKKRTNTFRTPPLHLLNTARESDKRAYEVCPTCLGRCNRFGHEYSHEKLIHYCNKLEARGTIRGRVQADEDNLVWRLDLPFMHQDAWIAAIRERVSIRSVSGEIVPVTAVVSNGVLVVTVDTGTMCDGCSGRA